MNSLFSLLIVLSLGLFVNTNTFEAATSDTGNEIATVQECEFDTNGIFDHVSDTQLNGGLGCELLSNCSGSAACGGAGEMLGPCTINCNDGSEIRCGNKVMM